MRAAEFRVNSRKYSKIETAASGTNAGYVKETTVWLKRSCHSILTSGCTFFRYSMGVSELFRKSTGSAPLLRAFFILSEAGCRAALDVRESQLLDVCCLMLSQHGRSTLNTQGVTPGAQLTGG